MSTSIFRIIASFGDLPNFFLAQQQSPRLAGKPFFDSLDTTFLNPLKTTLLNPLKTTLFQADIDPLLNDLLVSH